PFITKSGVRVLLPPGPSAPTVAPDAQPFPTATSGDILVIVLMVIVVMVARAIVVIVLMVIVLMVIMVIVVIVLMVIVLMVIVVIVVMVIVVMVILLMVIVLMAIRNPGHGHRGSFLEGCLAAATGCGCKTSRTSWPARRPPTSRPVRTPRPSRSVYARLRYGQEYSGDWIVSSPRNLANVKYELYDACLARDPITALNKMGAAGFRPCTDPPEIPVSSRCNSDSWEIMMYKDVWQ
ncbi:unnamed protein product, partial [Prorocentrum cordatum]